MLVSGNISKMAQLLHQHARSRTRADGGKGGWLRGEASHFHDWNVTSTVGGNHNPFPTTVPTKSSERQVKGGEGGVGYKLI